MCVISRTPKPYPPTISVWHIRRYIIIVFCKCFATISNILYTQFPVGFDVVQRTTILVSYCFHNRNTINRGVLFTLTVRGDITQWFRCGGIINKRRHNDVHLRTRKYVLYFWRVALRTPEHGTVLSTSGVHRSCYVGYSLSNKWCPPKFLRRVQAVQKVVSPCRLHMWVFACKCIYYYCPPGLADRIPNDINSHSATWWKMMESPFFLLLWENLHEWLVFFSGTSIRRHGFPKIIHTLTRRRIVYLSFTKTWVWSGTQQLSPGTFLSTRDVHLSSYMSPRNQVYLLDAAFVTLPCNRAIRRFRIRHVFPMTRPYHCGATGRWQVYNITLNG